MFKTIKSSVKGFSIVELMVVVVIIAGLAALGSNRLMMMVARGRQAEAKTNLSSIHQLQSAFQLHADNYAQWTMSATNVIGYKGDGNRNCTIDTGTTASGVGRGAANTDGAHALGYKPKGCEEMRYGYGVVVQTPTAGGIERYFAIAYAASDTDARIFPTCDGEAGGRTVNAGKGGAVTASKSDIRHELQHTTDYNGLHFTGGTSALGGTDKKGDAMGVSEEKVWQHNNIIDACD